MIRLVSQTPWTTTKEPVLQLRVNVRNDGDTTIDGPAIGWAIGPRVDLSPAVRGGARAGARPSPHPQTRCRSRRIWARGTPWRCSIPIDVSEIPGASTRRTPASIRCNSHFGVNRSTMRSPSSRRLRSTSRGSRRSQGPVLVVDGDRHAGGVRTRRDPDRCRIGGDPRSERTASWRRSRRSPTSCAGARSGAEFDLIVSPAALDQLRQASDGYERSDGTGPRGERRRPSHRG